MFRHIAKVATRAKELFHIDPNAMVAAQMALSEAMKVTTIANPRQAVSFFVDCFVPLTFGAVYKTPNVKLDLVDRVLGMLQFRDATVPLPVALPLALYADSMLNNFGFEAYAGDIGLHFSRSSSLGSKGRLVFNLVRALKPIACLEIGTAYGVSAYLIARSQELCGLQTHVVTVENSSPQKDVSRGFLQKHFPQTVKTIHADKYDAIAQLVGASEQFEFVFHDNGHSGDHYVRDFTELLPLMPAGGVFVLDDINWHGHGQDQSQRTCYQGWLEIIRHRRVAAAIEICSSMGVVFLR